MTIMNKCPILQAIFGARRQQQNQLFEQPILESVSTEFLEYDMQTMPIQTGPQRLITRYVEYYIPTIEIIRTARELSTQFF